MEENEGGNRLTQVHLEKWPLKRSVCVCVWILLELKMMDVVVTTETIRRAKLQSKCHHQQSNTQPFTGQMPFLSPNQQYQSTEGNPHHVLVALNCSETVPFLFLLICDLPHFCQWRHSWQLVLVCMNVSLYEDVWRPTAAVSGTDSVGNPGRSGTCSSRFNTASCRLLQSSAAAAVCSQQRVSCFTFFHPCILLEKCQHDANNNATDNAKWSTEQKRETLC